MAHVSLGNGPLLLWLAVVCTCMVMGCACPQDRERELAERCARITNDGITWDGADPGIWPWITGVDEQWLLETPLDPKPLLLQALDDPEKWVAAHVLLTQRWGLESGQEFTVGPEAYNGLRVMLFADGSVEIDPRQQPKIREKWRAILGVFN